MIKFVKLMISKIFLKFIIFDKTINFIKVMINKIFIKFVFLIKLLIL
jgi:hypothetical protein